MALNSNEINGNDTIGKDTILKIEDLSIAFGGLKAVDSLSFDIKEKEIFGLIGQMVQGKPQYLTVLHSFINRIKELYYSETIKTW